MTTGKEVKRYILKNSNNFEVTFLSFGATIQSIKTKDRNGKSVNVVLGLNSTQGNNVCYFHEKKFNF